MKMLQSRLQFKGEAQVLERRVLRVLFGEERFKAIAHRPLDADFGVVPHEAAFVLRVVEAGALIDKCRRLAEHHETVRKSLGNVELFLVFGRKHDTFPLAKRRTPLAKVNGYVKDFTLDDADKLSLRVLLLEMKSAKNALLTAGFIVLHKDHVEAGSVEFSLVVGFHKVAAMVAKDRRLDDGHALNGRLYKIKLSHFKSPIDPSTEFTLSLSKGLDDT